MGGVRGMGGGATRALWWAGGVALFIALSCGEALSPCPGGWQRFASLPIEYNVYGIDSVSPTVWAVARSYSSGESVILKYEDGAFTVDYISPYENEDTWLTDIGFTTRGEPGWVGGGKRNSAGKRVPYLISYDFAREEWREEALPGGVEGVITRVVPISGGGCWLLIDKDFNGGAFDARDIPRKGDLALFRDGALKFYENLGAVSAAVPGGPRGRGIIFALEYVLAPGGPSGSASLFVSEDDGASWTDEKVPADLVRGHRIEELWAAEADGLTLYLVAEFAQAGYWGVIKRSGRPGAGEYELVFMAPQGPYFRGIKDIALRDPSGEKIGVGVDGVVTGDETSVVFNEGNVLYEQLPYGLNIVSAGAASGTGFWAAGENKVTENFEFLYHP